MKKNNYIVIIPAFNESESILKVVNQFIERDIDYIVVDDCSYDSTALILRDNNINYISNNQNLGLSKTMRVGMKYALEKGYDYCIQFDGDGQHDIKTIEKMVNKIQEGFNIVTTSRFINEKPKMSSKLIAWKMFIQRFKKNGINITDPTCGLRMYDKNFMNDYTNFEKFEVEPSTILYAVKKFNYKITEIPTIVYERTTGKSLFSNPIHVIYYMIKQLRRLYLTTIFWKYHKIKK